MAGSTGSTRSSVRRGRRLGVLGLLLAAALLLVAPTGRAYAAGDEGMDSFVAVYDLQPDGSMKVTETITWRFPTGEQTPRHLPRRRRADGVEQRGEPLPLLRHDRRRGLEPERRPRHLPRQRQRRRPGDPDRVGGPVHQRHSGLQGQLHAPQRAQPDHGRRQAGHGPEPGRHGRALLQRLRDQRDDAARPGLDHRQRTGGVDEGRLLPGHQPVRHAVPGHVGRPGALLRRGPRAPATRCPCSPPTRASAFGDVRADVRQGTPGPRSAPTRPRPPTRRPGPAPSVPPSWRWP